MTNSFSSWRPSGLGALAQGDNGGMFARLIVPRSDGC